MHQSYQPKWDIADKGVIMNKAILVIDMPNCCNECFAFNDSGDYSECLITKDFRGYRFRSREQKMYNCPLKPLPEKYDTDNFLCDMDYDGEFEYGYNTCIDEILSN